MDTSTKPSVVLRDAAIAAAHVAIKDAVANAAKPGRNTTELWTSILLPSLTAAGGVALKLAGGAAVAAVPWLAIPVAAIGAGLAAFGYSISRGNVKAAALEAASVALSKAETDLEGTTH